MTSRDTWRLAAGHAHVAHVVHAAHVVHVGQVDGHRGCSWHAWLWKNWWSRILRICSLNWAWYRGIVQFVLRQLIISKYVHGRVNFLDDHERCVLTLPVTKMARHCENILVEAFQGCFLKHKVNSSASIQL